MAPSVITFVDCASYCPSQIDYPRRWLSGMYSDILGSAVDVKVLPGFFRYQSLSQKV